MSENNQDLENSNSDTDQKDDSSYSSDDQRSNEEDSSESQERIEDPIKVKRYTMSAKPSDKELIDVKQIQKPKSVKDGKIKSKETLHYNESKIIADDEVLIDNKIKDVIIKYEIFKNIIDSKIVTPINLQIDKLNEFISENTDD